MSVNGDDINRTLMTDGNSVAGLLYDLFGTEMTAQPTECAACGREGELATLLAFTHAPGVVLRCPACDNAMVRVVRRGSHTYLDARGAVYLRVTR
jgi:hypothetical protein